ncbi:MAG: TrmJ/YjtD family RNA methyltransferase [Cyanobacteriota bacterium]|nr:TrmJ/YjtD family RNA methyltransferase [Cyanobacteriota bacterium]
MSLHLVLVEPRGARNVGSVARLCANFAIDELRLVAPRCDALGPEARQMAVHGVSHLERAVIFPDLAAALADCRRVVAATGRLEGAPLPLREPREALAWLWAEGTADAASGGAGAALVFGREDRGLSNDELLRAGCLLCIPAASTYPSLNLSHAVAVALHQLWRLRQGGEDGCALEARVAQAGAASEPLAPAGAAEAALADAEALLLEVGFLHPHTARARMAKLRALLQRAQPSDNEVALLRGMVCQLRWASRRGGDAGGGH